MISGMFITFLHTMFLYFLKTQILSITGFQELRLYWCWKATTETDRNARLNEVGTSNSGRVDANTAKNLVSKPEHGWKRDT